MKINDKYRLSKDQYVSGHRTEKKQIIIHHTVSGNGVAGDVAWWNQTKSRIATHFIISREGEVFQCFPIENWGYHVYVKSPGNKIEQKYRANGHTYDKHSVGIELDSWGGLTLKNGKLFNAVGREFKGEHIKYDNYRGYQFFEKYTDKQIEALRELLTYLGDVLKIPIWADETIFDINKKALEFQGP
jgi:N-acetyl-anhydromuramyl-L-alanine amidase AmpD